MELLDGAAAALEGERDPRCLLAGFAAVTALAQAFARAGVAGEEASSASSVPCSPSSHCCTASLNFARNRHGKGRAICMFDQEQKHILTLHSIPNVLLCHPRYSCIYLLWLARYTLIVYMHISVLAVPANCQAEGHVEELVYVLACYFPTTYAPPAVPGPDVVTLADT